MTKDEALRLALEALEECEIPWPNTRDVKVTEAITAIKAALEAKDEPVAWMLVQGNHEEPSLRQLDDWEIQNGWKQYPLYTTPPQRTWVGLTDEELSKLEGTHIGRKLAQAIEAKLRSKNT